MTVILREGSGDFSLAAREVELSGLESGSS